MSENLKESLRVESISLKFMLESVEQKKRHIEYLNDLITSESSYPTSTLVTYKTCKLCKKTVKKSNFDKHLRSEYCRIISTYYIE